MFGIVAIVIIALIALVLIIAASKPDRFRVQRSISVKAGPEALFALINDFHQWPLWSPWEKLDPTMQRSYSGATSGKGAIYAWEGNKKIGQGRMEILDTAINANLTIQLDFFKPFEAHNTAEFTLAAAAESTTLTWVMHGPHPFMFKLMSTFISMDKIVGKDFETGLANLKALVEK